jgi:hypothetical protein
MKRTIAMGVAACVAAMIGILQPGNVSQAATKANAKECRLQLFDSIDLVVSDSGDLYVPVSFDGHPGMMSLTLSSGLSFINEGALESLGLPTERAPIEAYINGAKAIRLARFRRLAIGNAGFGKGEFLVNAGSVQTIEVAGKPVLGALGTEAFTVVDFELDLSRRKLTLFSQDHCPGNVVYWADEWGSAPLYISPVGTLYFPVELENRKVEANFEPGAPFTRLSTDVTKRLYGFDTSSPGIETEPSPRGGEPESHFRAMQLTAPGMTVRNSRIRLVPAPAKMRADIQCTLQFSGRRGGGVGYSGCENRYPMNLGRNVLTQMRFYFATKEKKIYFTLANATKGAPAAPAAPDGTGGQPSQPLSR